MEDKTIISSSDDFTNSMNKSSDEKGFNAIFDNVIFESEVILSDKIVYLHFTNCVFEKSLTVNLTTNQDVKFTSCIFKGLVKFDGSHFEDKIRFYKSEFHEKVSFNNTKFEDLADFWAVKFYKKTIFYKTDFNGTTVFSYSNFKENVLFTYTLFDKLVILKNTVFEKGLDLSLALILGKIKVYNIQINDYNVNHTPEENIEEYHKMVAENGLIPVKNKRETFRIIKSQLKSDGNNIDSRKFAALEFEAQHHFLSHSIFKKGKIRGNIQNYLILLLNWVSNNNGNSWLRGVIFTVGFGLLFFYFSIISTENYTATLSGINENDTINSLKYFIKFLNPTHKADYMLSEKPSLCSYIWDFIGRISVSYGIFQTIAAFRKYRN